MALSIPPGYGEAWARGETRDDPGRRRRSDSNSTNVALGYAARLLAGYMRGADRGAHWRPTPEPLVTADIRVWFNPDLESRDFMIPGIVALLLLVITTNLSAMAIVRRRSWARSSN